MNSRSTHMLFALGSAILIVAGAAGGADRLSAQEEPDPAGVRGVTYQDLLQGLWNPSRWLTYSGDYTGQRHSPLTQITPENVDRLVPVWTFQAGVTARGRGFEA